MTFAIATVALVLALGAPPAGPSDDPRAVVRHATRAVERDSVTAARRRWAARLARDTADRAAALGLATLERAVAAMAETAQ